MTAEKDANPMVRLAEDAVELAATGQKVMLGALAAEMRMLAAMVPGQAPEQPADPQAEEARQRAEQAEIEAGFDNMPV